jgi:hypothetical protein
MDIREIVQQAGMSDRPAYYSGRGATISDLNSQILQKIHESIVKNIGAEAGKEFIQLVDEIEVMSATGFLQALYSLARNNWKFDPAMVKSNGTDIDSEGSAWGTLLGSMSRGKRDDSDSIKNEFLRKHGVLTGGGDYDSYRRNPSKGRTVFKDGAYYRR